MDKIRTIDTLTIETSSLCCNFVNTVHAWRGENLNEYLKTYEDVINWCKKLSVFDEPYLRSLAAEASRHPQKAAWALTKMKEVRTLLYQLISAISAGEEGKYNQLLEKVYPLLSEALSHIKPVYEENTFKISFAEKVVDLESPLWPILKSVYDLLLTSDLKRIKECPICGWVFLDETKNGARRWCSPVECGTKDKMQRYNEKKKLAVMAKEKKNLNEK
jgi:predicted RNA-binding Zn ribbon-like protein